jgi:hydrogenase expression/formation protein HypD
MGTAEYEPLARDYRVPVVVTGFEPLDIMQGVALCIGQLESGRAEVENQYARAVLSAGNASARAMISQVFAVRDRDWRGIGAIAQSGLGLSAAYAHLDAEVRFGRATTHHCERGECISGTILLGHAKPPDCPAFGTRCTPERPLGATMVSAEGACAAYFRYRAPLPA